jgi:hypothetical protein
MCITQELNILFLLKNNKESPLPTNLLIITSLVFIEEKLFDIDQLFDKHPY